VLYEIRNTLSDMKTTQEDMNMKLNLILNNTEEIKDNASQRLRMIWHGLKRHWREIHGRMNIL